MHKIFVGFDPRQVVSYTVLSTSILASAKTPVSISPLQLDAFKANGLETLRLFVPGLCNFEGWALYLDPNVMVLGDLGELFDMADSSRSMYVHPDTSRDIILFNCAHPDNRILTPEFIKAAEGSHESHCVGMLPSEWCHQVGYDNPRDDAKIVHFVQGIPAFPETNGCEYSQVWWAMHSAANGSQPWAQIMADGPHTQELPDGRKVPKLMKVA